MPETQEERMERYKREMEYRKQWQDFTKMKLRQYGYDPDIESPTSEKDILKKSLQVDIRFGGHIPESHDECMTAVLEALNFEGIVAWPGDATSIVAQMMMALINSGRKENEQLPL